MFECKEADKELKTLTFNFKLDSVKELEVNGVKIGVIEGYASTFNNMDRGGDICIAGCFTKTIQEHKDRNRQVRMKNQHGKLIGGFLPEMMKEDGKGLFVVGHINLDVQEGREVYALAKQGVMEDMSIGYRAIDYEIDNEVPCRKLKEVKLWEISTVDEPMNPEAQVTAVKSHDKIYAMTTIKEVSDFLKAKGFSNEEDKALIVKIKQLSTRQNADETLHKASEEVEAFLLEQKLNAINSVLKS